VDRVIAIIGLVLSAISTAFTTLAYLQERARIRVERAKENFMETERRFVVASQELATQLAEAEIEYAAGVRTGIADAAFDRLARLSEEEFRQRQGGGVAALAKGAIFAEQKAARRLGSTTFPIARWRGQLLMASSALIIATALNIWLAWPVF
jgi:hypothetical protein